MIKIIINNFDKKTTYYFIKILMIRWSQRLTVTYFQVFHRYYWFK